VGTIGSLPAIQGDTQASPQVDVAVDTDSPGSLPSPTPMGCTLPPRALKKANKEAMAEASIVQAWVEPTRPVGADEEAVRFRDAMHNVCDASMPRAGSPLVIVGRYIGGPRRLLSCGRPATGPAAALHGTAACGAEIKITSRSRPRCTICAGLHVSHSPSDGPGLGLPRGDSERRPLGAPVQDRAQEIAHEGAPRD